MLIKNKTQWYQELIDPMSDALNGQDEAEFDRARGHARDVSGNPEFDPDIACAVGLLVSYHDFLRYVAFMEPELAIGIYPTTRAALLQDTVGPESDLTRRRYYLQLRIVADNMEIESLEIEEFRELFAALEFLELHTEQWYFAANFAFRHRDLETISRAYEQFLLYRDEKDNELFQWIRLSVMYRLLREEAGSGHVEKLILSIRTAANAREVHSLLLPEIERQGLMNAQLEKLLDDTLAQMERLD